MRFQDVFAASLVAPLVAAHGGDFAGAPKLFGMPGNLRARNPFAGHDHVASHGHVAGPRLQARQGGNAENRCGTQGGGASCDAGFCCSAEGYCGATKDHCAAPDCQINFGPGCDANKSPYGASTRNDARRQLGNIAYGGWGIRECLKPMTVAITYDDGPYIYTEEVMAQFEAKNAKATFFITGNNLGKGSIDENWTGVISKMYAKGHQIASHTWSHQNLDQITHEQRMDQMVKNEMAIRNIIGKYPTYMRPPYSACESEACQADMKALGYVVTSFDLDTDDYNQLTREKIQVAKDNFKKGIDSARPNGKRLAIGHDIHELTALNLTAYMLDYVYSSGFTAVTVGECMNDPVANWYRDSAPGVKPGPTPISSAPVPTPTGPTSVDGQCGTGTGQSCIGFIGPDGLSECCSPAGWCGRSEAHCSTGCNTLFGKCGPQPAISSSVFISVSATSASATVSSHSSVSASPSASSSPSGQICGKGVYPTKDTGFYANNQDTTVDSCSALCTADSSCKWFVYAFNNECWRFNEALDLADGSVETGDDYKTFERKCFAETSASPTPVSSSSVYVSSTPSPSPSPSASASVSKHESSSATIVQSSSASVSASASKHESSSVSIAHSSSASASASASASQHDYSVVPSSKTADHISSTVSPSASASKHDEYSVTTSTSDVHSIHNPIPTSAPHSTDNIDSSSTSTAIHPSQSTTRVYPSSTLSTIVRPSSTPCDDDKATPAPTPTPSVPISKDGKCGSANGGQTCAGYKNPFGESVECCCKESGRCSTDPWACGVGCDAKYGNCETY